MIIPVTVTGCAQSLPSPSPSPAPPPPAGSGGEALPWYTGMSKLTRSVTCGTKLQFDWDGGYHDVYLAPGTACTSSGGTRLAPLGMSGSYTWTATSNGVFNLLCSYGSHCEFGNMQVLVTVSGCAQQATPSPSPSPQPVATTDSVPW
jgi:hypothetical protein